MVAQRTTYSPQKSQGFLDDRRGRGARGMQEEEGEKEEEKEQEEEVRGGET